MMTDPMERRVLRAPKAGFPRVIAVFSYRYDAHLVPALIENISPFVHGYVAWDDRGGQPALTSEPERRNRLNATAVAMGADWILAVDPDERFETGLADRIGDLTRDKEARVLWTFQVRELFTPGAWRSDGIWGGKVQMRLYPAHAVQGALDRPLHGQWVVPDKRYRTRATGLNLYHLRHISAERGRLRRDTYAAADPDRLYTAVGYDYLADPRGAVFRDIPAGRGYLPAHADDGGLWGPPDVGLIGSVSPDPAGCRLTLIARSLRQRGGDAAAHMAGDIAALDPADSDMVLVAAGLALNAGRRADALRMVEPLAHLPSPPLMALAIAGQAQARLGRTAAAGAHFAALKAAAPDSAWAAQRHAALLPDGLPFDSPQALWRRWCKGDAQLHEGRGNGSDAVAVVIIGFRAQKGLEAAVASVRDQSPEAEIVVVNSAGGNVRHQLRRHLDRIRLIAVEEPLRVGAARNIGIDASSAPWIAFLAGDCQALPGWVAGRLARHKAGAVSVSTPVVPSRPGSMTGALVQGLRFRGRDPSLTAEEAQHFGRSYARDVFLQAGYFSPGLRLGEDDELNARLGRVAEPVWAPEILTRHADPATPFGMVLDAWNRARRSADHLHAGQDDRKPNRKPALTRRMVFLTDRAQGISFEAQGFGPLRRRMAALFVRLFLTATALGLRKAGRRLDAADRAARAAEKDRDSKPDQALIAAREAVRLAPQNWRHHLLLGRILAVRDAVPEALDALMRAHAIAPVRADPVASATTLLLREGRPAEALVVAEMAVILTPSEPGILMAAARVALAAGEAALALAFGQAALTADPSLPEAHVFLAGLHDAAGDARMAARRRGMLAEITRRERGKQALAAE
jgi:glycosyltransferase involved in cell wall biosynthesis/Tfp pilus assembly protein PilF